MTGARDAALWILQAARTKLAVNVRLANAYNVALAATDADYRKLLVETGVNFPDGSPVALVMKLQNSSSQRVRGPSLMTTVLELSPSSVRHFFLGGTTQTLAQLVETVRSKYPNVTIAGSYSPPFSPLSEEYFADCAQAASAVNADLIWVGLGTPKQDLVGTAISDRVGTPSVNVGAAFGFIAGTVREAPRWVQRTGFEWLFRLVLEPRRLWRRYAIGNLVFVASATAGLIARRSQPSSPATTKAGAE